MIYKVQNTASTLHLGDKIQTLNKNVKLSSTWVYGIHVYVKSKYSQLKLS